MIDGNLTRPLRLEMIYVALLDRVCRDLGYAVAVDETLAERTLGTCFYAERRIALAPMVDSEMRVMTLAHEIGHALHHQLRPQDYIAEGDTMGEHAEMNARMLGWCALAQASVQCGSPGVIRARKWSDFHRQ